jgi:hypothetical protein
MAGAASPEQQRQTGLLWQQRGSGASMRSGAGLHPAAALRRSLSFSSIEPDRRISLGEVFQMDRGSIEGERRRECGGQRQSFSFPLGPAPAGRQGAALGVAAESGTRALAGQLPQHYQAQEQEGSSRYTAFGGTSGALSASPMGRHQVRQADRRM